MTPLARPLSLPSSLAPSLVLRLFPLFFLDPATVIRGPLINVSSFEDPNVFEEHVEGGYIRVYIQGVNIYLMETSFSRVDPES